jgi:hypothetical protein
MMYLLITPITLLIISYLIRDKDIVEVSRYLSGVIILDIISWILFPTYYYYIRSALIDILMFIVVFQLNNVRKSLLVGVPCMISFLLNIIEQFSYYETIFYPYRPYIQFALMQCVLWGLIYGCRWRQVCSKTHTLK